MFQDVESSIQARSVLEPSLFQDKEDAEVVTLVGDKGDSQRTK